jgi:hypothetical protein
VRRMNARLPVCILIGASAALVAASAAQAALLTVAPAAPCHLSGQTLSLQATDFVPLDNVLVSLDGRSLGALSANALGAAAWTLTLGTIGGARPVVIDPSSQSNRAIAAATTLPAADLAVRVSPQNGSPGRRRRIVATGFVGGEGLYVHVVRGHSARTRRLGNLGAPCGTLTIGVRLLPRRARTGVYTVQFDTVAAYSADTPLQVRGKLTVYRTARRAAAAARWVR